MSTLFQHESAEFKTVYFQIANLDFTPIVRNEKLQPAPPEAIKKFKEIEKTKQGNQ